MVLAREQRADLVTVRTTLLRAEEGIEDCDFKSAASMVDRVLATTCPHDSDQWVTSPDAKTARPLTTCYKCGVSWFSDFSVSH